MPANVDACPTGEHGNQVCTCESAFLAAFSGARGLSQQRSARKIKPLWAQIVQENSSFTDTDAADFPSDPASTEAFHHRHSFFYVFLLRLLLQHSCIRICTRRLAVPALQPRTRTARVLLFPGILFEV